MHSIPVGTPSRLRAIDQAMGVEFRPVQGLSEPSAHSQTPQFHDTKTLSQVEHIVQQAFESPAQGGTKASLIFGEGNPQAELVFVGDRPHPDDQSVGRPFGGAAGEKLDQIISAMGFTRSSVYLCNVIKTGYCTDAALTEAQIAQHLAALERQLCCIAPRVIVALGSLAASSLLGGHGDIEASRGQWGTWRGPAGELHCHVMPTFHPNHLLEHYTPEVRGHMWSDMRQVMDQLAQ